MAQVSLLFLSDLHAYSSSKTGSGPSPSYIEVGKSNATERDDVFEALKALVRREKLTPDIVLCGGDLGDRADPAGLVHAWRELHQVAHECGASRALAVCGNHDLDSRYLKGDADPDPKGVLQDLVPRFPAGDESLCDQFWAKNYVVVDDASRGFRIVLLNSSAFHGGLQSEIDHGRVSSRTVERLRSELRKAGPRDLNVFVCHHHPFPHQRLDGKADYEAIKNGQSLINLLDEPDHGPWLMLHGHRHNARITYGASTLTNIPVIGAASFSAKTDAANQVHLITCESADTLSYKLRGKVRSWTFSLGTGFVWNSVSNNGLPGECGFGFKGNLTYLASTVKQFIVDTGKAYVDWSEVCKAIPDVDFIAPEGFQHFVASLPAAGIVLSFDGSGRPLEARNA